VGIGGRARQCPGLSLPTLPEGDRCAVFRKGDLPCGRYHLERRDNVLALIAAH
jgi:hypothetical protein